jgi:hypothetical protein
MAALRQRLDEIRPWYASGAVLQVLALLVLVAAAAAGAVWYRMRRAGRSVDPWYQPSPDSVLDSQLDAGVPELRVDPPLHGVRAETELQPQARVQRDTAPAPAVVAPGLVFEFPRPGASIPPPVAPPVPVVDVAAQRGPIEFEVPLLPDKPRRAAPRGVLRVETLAAAFEEVEFLSSLGLPSDAMDVLKTYLEGTASPAPLAFFELMRLSEAEEDHGATAAVRRRYTQVYNLEAPAVEQVTAPLGLDSIPDLSARITAAWGRSVALDIIEQALFSVPAPGAALTLQAGRDLICLYDVAMNLAAEGETAAFLPGGETEAHALAPWAHADDPTGALVAAQAAAEADGSFPIDFDLDTPVEMTTRSVNPFDSLELEPLEAPAAPAPTAAPASKADAEDAFSAAVASERSRY